MDRQAVRESSHGLMEQCTRTRGSASDGTSRVTVVSHLTFVFEWCCCNRENLIFVVSNVTSSTSQQNLRIPQFYWPTFTHAFFSYSGVSMTTLLFLNSDEFVTAYACWFLLFTRLCALSFTVCQEPSLLAEQGVQVYQILFTRGHDPSTHVREVRFLTLVGDLIWVCHCHWVVLLQGCSCWLPLVMETQFVNWIERVTVSRLHNSFWARNVSPTLWSYCDVLHLLSSFGLDRRPTPLSWCSSPLYPCAKTHDDTFGTPGMPPRAWRPPRPRFPRRRWIDTLWLLFHWSWSPEEKIAPAMVYVLVATTRVVGTACIWRSSLITSMSLTAAPLSWIDFALQLCSYLHSLLFSWLNRRA